MKLPDIVPVPPEVVHAIAARHGLAASSAVPIPSAGIINSVYALGPRYVLRVPRDHPAHIDQARAEAVTIPAAVAAGVRTPALVVFDEACDILSVPYLVVERVRGVDLESLGAEAGAVWREVGADLARLHAAVDPSMAGASDEFVDPRGFVEERVADGWISALEARWLETWIARLAPEATGPTPARLVHGDVQMSNVLVDPGTLSYVALLDWGCARRDEAACDFLAMPMRAVPALLDGYRGLGAVVDDATLEARILLRRLALVLGVLPRGPAPGCSWGERPVAWLADLLRFFVDPPDERWRRLGPPPA